MLFPAISCDVFLCHAISCYNYLTCWDVFNLSLNQLVLMRLRIPTNFSIQDDPASKPSRFDVRFLRLRRYSNFQSKMNNFRIISTVLRTQPSYLPRSMLSRYKVFKVSVGPSTETNACVNSKPRQLAESKETAKQPVDKIAWSRFVPTCFSCFNQLIHISSLTSRRTSADPRNEP